MLRVVALVRPPEEARVLARLKAADEAAFARVANFDTPTLDATLPRLTHAADHGKIWFAIAALLWASGGKRQRRAALRGLVALSITSGVVNGPMKGAMKRQRPLLNPVAMARRTKRAPRTSSFPSGHSASAAAFAAGVAMESPAVGVVAVPLAAAVGFSRVYTGVHYPGDVIVGAAVGAGIAAATTKWWPISPADVEQPTRHLSTVCSDVPSPHGEGLVIVVNPNAGPALSANPADVLREALPEAEIVEVESGDDMEAALRGAADRAKLLGVAGGDGSVNTAAAIAQERGIPLMVVPGGTLNHLARDLGIDGVEEAAKALKDGHVVQLDVAEIDGRAFLNTASFGAYPELVDAREKLESTVGKWPALAIALVRVLATGQCAEVEIDGTPHKIWMAFIGNCRYHPAGFGPSWRERLDDGELDVRWVDASQPWGRTRLVAAVLTGRLGRSRVYHEQRVKELRVRSLQGSLRLARDGETFDGGTEFVVRKRPTPLTVIVPEQVAEG
jgi:undecaprenyl-diphosphatase